MVAMASTTSFHGDVAPPMSAARCARTAASLAGKAQDEVLGVSGSGTKAQRARPQDIQRAAPTMQELSNRQVDTLQTSWNTRRTGSWGRGGQRPQA